MMVAVFSQLCFCSNPNWCGNQARNSISAPGADRSEGAWVHHSQLHASRAKVLVNSGNFHNIPRVVQTGASKSDGSALRSQSGEGQN